MTYRPTFVFISLILFFAQCKSTPKKTTDKIIDDKQVIVTQDDTVTSLPLTEKEAALRNNYFNADKQRDEVFRFFISSDEFARKQLGHEKKFSINDDPETDKELCEELKKTYDKIDYRARAVVKIELYPDSGKISRVRFIRPSGLSEMDKLISEDVSRLQFNFVDENSIEPNSFRISYFILLRNRLSREEAMRLLKKVAK